MHSHACCLASVLTVLLFPANGCAQDAGKQDAGKAPSDLPTFLKAVPGGKVWLGVAAERMIELVCETVNPTRPADAAKEPNKIQMALKRHVSELGHEQVVVETFLLGTSPVTNKQYRAFVDKMRELKIEIRPPYHWWRYGRKDDYEAKIEEIRQQFPKEGALAPVLYWERHGTELPYELKDEFGKPIDDLPVTYVSYRDALRCAGWLGMRLPTEAERTRAVRGDTDFLWVWGGTKELGDHYSEKALEWVKIKNMRDQVAKPVGTLKNGVGPYGHTDLVAQVWEYVAEQGYHPMLPKEFPEQWKKLQKDKLGALAQNQPAWKDEKVIAKGGSYLSWGDPIQLHVDARAPMTDQEAVESVGFRLAKSLKPGYDALFTLQRSVHNTSLFANDQKIDLGGQVGAERYELGESGFPAAYHTISVAPANWLSSEKNAAFEKLLEHSRQVPLVIGTLALTEKGSLPAGHYTILYRQEGMPPELSEALKAGFKDVQAALKAAERNTEPKEEKGKTDWKGVLTRYGLTPKDLEPKDALEKVKFVRLGTFEVPTDKSYYVFYNSEGNYTGMIEAVSRPNTVNAFAGDLVLGAYKGKDTDKGATVATVRFGVPLLAGNPKRVVEFRLEVQMDCPPPSAANPWRLPATANAEKQNAEKPKAEAGKPETDPKAEAGGGEKAGGDKPAGGDKAAGDKTGSGKNEANKESKR